MADPTHTTTINASAELRARMVAAARALGLDPDDVLSMSIEADGADPRAVIVIRVLPSAAAVAALAGETDITPEEG